LVRLHFFLEVSASLEPSGPQWTGVPDAFLRFGRFGRMVGDSEIGISPNAGPKLRWGKGARVRRGHAGDIVISQIARTFSTELQKSETTSRQRATAQTRQQCSASSLRLMGRRVDPVGYRRR